MTMCYDNYICNGPVKWLQLCFNGHDLGNWFLMAMSFHKCSMVIFWNGFTIFTPPPLINCSVSCATIFLKGSYALVQLAGKLKRFELH